MIRERLSRALERTVAQTRQTLTSAAGEFGRVVYSNSLGAEAMVLTDIIWSCVPGIDMFTIDTGRLHEETYELLEKLQRRYQRTIRVFYPDAHALEQLVASQGVNGFYQSVEARLACCRIRKVEPFTRAIAGYRAWVTGLRREQSLARAQARPLEWDAAHGLYKVSPLLEWSEEQVWEYIRVRHLPYNLLHDRHFPSIGCSPCTRAIQPGESRRAGRWWWEQPESRECGLHPRVSPAPMAAPA
ncbi:MAG TPA: phosphoadenylyl-sulfate reductase [Steroidobacteraceae bacterium]|nr:phosphoadenylyl-sulfate reductase [Steroidobacteraceae bacterium]